MLLFSLIKDAGADRPMLTHPDQICPGRKLRIPKLG